MTLFFPVIRLVNPSVGNIKTDRRRVGSLPSQIIYFDYGGNIVLVTDVQHDFYEGNLSNQTKVSES